MRASAVALPLALAEDPTWVSPGTQPGSGAAGSPGGAGTQPGSGAAGIPGTQPGSGAGGVGNSAVRQSAMAPPPLGARQPLDRIHFCSVARQLYMCSAMSTPREIVPMRTYLISRRVVLRH